MEDLPERLFLNPVWHALGTKHRQLAISAAGARRYPADVAPFAAVAGPDYSAISQLGSMLKPGEAVWITGERNPPVAGLCFEGTLPCLQIVMPASVVLPAFDHEVD